jgi:CRP-like cAMP-binding protein
MHEYLIKYINRFIGTSLTESEMELIKNVFVPKKIKKRHYFLQEGEVCKYSAFIVKGSMRQYSVDDKGIEHIVYLFIENWWANDPESFKMFTPSMYNIDAWEDTEALLITNTDLLNTLEQIPAISQLFKMLNEKCTIANQRRLTVSISLTAEKRYLDFASCYPEFLSRFPQHIIASYLGITTETLSRIRKQTVKK